MKTTIHLTGQESTQDLHSLRRDRIRERRIRKASLVNPVQAASAAEIITFPVPEFPRIA